ncbi:hypothetical protein BBD42_05105 [Paenibacillus sp. BIHB 4019]|uniref:Uncharacterized protein n=1 Tax=Paenibacillus sp. BIHB 4019 TaxID=1870819 RepID=A0A1B2DDZ8_9BACL|nr:hypothetical protein [Paenibacillus sp. BIHB 4019]ANY65915.1 hypothetical protein BBD42_05105 [Paenibacillus sp. BIHB 4019]
MSKLNKTVILTALLATLSVNTLPSISKAATPDIQTNLTISTNNIVTSSNDSKYYAGLLRDYVRTNEQDGTIYLDDSYKDTLYVPTEIIGSINAWLSIVNKDIKSGLATIGHNYEIIYKSNQPNSSNFVVKAAVTGGVDEVRTFWWGFEIWLSHATTNEIIVALTAGAAASKVVEIITKRLKSIPTTVILLIAEISTLVLGTGAAALKLTDKGNGVYISCFWPVPTPAMLVFSSLDPQY